MPRFRRPRSPVLLLRRVTAFALAVGALLLALRPLPADGPVAALPTAPVVVAAAELAPGSTLTAADLAVTQLPRPAVPDGVATEPGRLVGQVLAAPLRRGEPVTDVRLVGPRLWAQVPAGQVAAPVRLADLAVSTLLRAGDRVDVLATTPEAGASVVAAGALVLTAGASGTRAGTRAGSGTGSGSGTCAERRRAACGQLRPGAARGAVRVGGRRPRIVGLLGVDHDGVGISRQVAAALLGGAVRRHDARLRRRPATR